MAVPAEPVRVLDRARRPSSLASRRVDAAATRRRRSSRRRRGRRRARRRRRRRWAGRRRRRRRPASRRPGLDGDQAERLAVRRARRRGRRRGTSRPAAARGTGGTNRTWALDARARRPAPPARRAGPARTRSARRARPRPARRASRDAGASSSAAAAQQHVGRLERLDPADEQQHLGVRGQPDGRARAAPRVAGREQRRGPRPGCTTPTLPGSASYRSIELVGLPLGVGDQPVGGLDDLRLTDLATGRLGAVAARRGARFLTRAMVCMVCTSGTPHRSAASQPTWPDSQ